MAASSDSYCEPPRKPTSPRSLFAAPTRYAVQNYIGCAACGAPARQIKPVPLVTPHRWPANVRTAASADPLPQRRERSPRASSKRQMSRRHVPARTAPTNFVAQATIPPSESHIACHSIPVFGWSKTVVNSAPVKRRSKRGERFCRPNKWNPSLRVLPMKESSILRPVFHGHPNLDWPESQWGPQLSCASDPPMPPRPRPAPTIETCRAGPLLETAIKRPQPPTAWKGRSWPSFTYLEALPAPSGLATNSFVYNEWQDVQYSPCPHDALPFEAIGKSVSRPHCGMHKFTFELLSPKCCEP